MLDRWKYLHTFRNQYTSLITGEGVLFTERHYVNVLLLVFLVFLPLLPNKNIYELSLNDVYFSSDDKIRHEVPCDLSREDVCMKGRPTEGLKGRNKGGKGKET